MVARERRVEGPRDGGVISAKPPGGDMGEVEGQGPQHMYGEEGEQIDSAFVVELETKEGEPT